jgi:hypothetical protein
MTSLPPRQRGAHAAYPVRAAAPAVADLRAGLQPRGLQAQAALLADPVTGSLYPAQCRLDLGERLMSERGAGQHPPELPGARAPSSGPPWALRADAASW